MYYGHSFFSLLTLELQPTPNKLDHLRPLPIKTFTHHRKAIKNSILPIDFRIIFFFFFCRRKKNIFFFHHGWRRKQSQLGERGVAHGGSLPPHPYIVRMAFSGNYSMILGACTRVQRRVHISQCNNNSSRGRERAYEGAEQS